MILSSTLKGSTNTGKSLFINNSHLMKSIILLGISSAMACTADIGENYNSISSALCTNPPCVSYPLPSYCPLPRAAVDPFDIRTPGPSNGTFTDHGDLFQLWSPNDYTVLGISKPWGGSPRFFGLPGSNVIDDDGPGRVFGLALYDSHRWWQGCAATASCCGGLPNCNQPLYAGAFVCQDPQYPAPGHTERPEGENQEEAVICQYPTAEATGPCPTDGATDEQRLRFCPRPGINILGWNPVQGSDKHDTPTGIFDWSFTNLGALRVRTQPFHWNGCWDHPETDRWCCQTHKDDCPPVRADVFYTLDYRYLNDHVVEVAMQVQTFENLSSPHGSRDQEFPTYYVAHGNCTPGTCNDLWRLILPSSSPDGVGIPHSIFDPANENNTQNKTVENLNEPWVSFQNDTSSYGTALAADQGIKAFDIFDTKDHDYHNMRVAHRFAVPTNGFIRGVSYMTVGAFAQNEFFLHEVQRKRPPFGHVEYPPPGGFIDTRRNREIVVTGWVLDGWSPTKDANITDPTVEASQRPRISIEIDNVPITIMGKSYFYPNVKRPDVCQTYPGYLPCPTPPKETEGPNDSLVGFQVTVPAPTPTNRGCPNLLRVIATDPDNNRTILGESLIQRGSRL